MRRIFAVLLLFALPAVAQPQKPLDAAELRLALDKLLVVGSALYVAAHPDDENTALLSWLENEKLVRAAYLSITRGEGGQNLIGSEKGDLLGVIRTQELLAARRIDGAEQFFTSATDFGYSKTPEETLQIWGKEKILGDVVWVVRSFQPDVIITRFPSTGEGGHGHHTASAILAEEAFRAAADPKRFPEQLKYVSTWQPKRLMWNAFQRRTPGGPPEQATEGLAVDLGTYNPILGRSYTEIAAVSRSMHKSQGFGSAERRGTLLARLQHIAGEPARNDLFEGIALRWNRLPDGNQVEQPLKDAIAAFDPAEPYRVVPHLVRAHELSGRLASNPSVEAKRAEILEVIRAASGLWLEAIARTPAASPGAAVQITVGAVNRSPLKVSLRATSPITKEAAAGELRPNELFTHELKGQIPSDAAVTQPHWLTVSAPQQLTGRADNPPALSVPFDVTIEGQTLRYDVPVLFRTVDRVKGELYRPFVIAPAITIEPEEPIYVFNGTKERTVSVTLRRTPGQSVETGSVALSAPSGWRVTPQSREFRIPNGSDTTTVSFAVIPPAGVSRGELLPIVNGAASSDRALVSIDYDHIPEQMLFPRASSRVVRVDAATRGNNIGYVTGPGDDVPQAIEQLGFNVTHLSDEALQHQNLSAYDAIVTGIRAYNTRAALRSAQGRLLQYVENGGTLVVQYNTSDESLPELLGPFPLKLSRDRVTVENAPVTTTPHPLLTSPNRIGAADFEGWVQERGLYFPGEWDPRYETMIATNDPGEPAKPGALLYARHGKGVYVYAPLAFFRQLPAGVPGAYRLFANLVSARQ